MPTTRVQEDSEVFCSFCGKSAAEVGKLIAGPTVFICVECVELCVDIFAEERRVIADLPGREASAPAPDAPTPEAIYVPYLRGAGDGWTTALAVRLANGNYRIEGGAPESLRTQFPAGTIVRCALIVSPDGETALAAIEKA